MSCSSSNRSNPMEFPSTVVLGGGEGEHSSSNGRKAIESLTDLRRVFRLTDEKSRNSSIHDGGCMAVAATVVAVEIKSLSMSEDQFWVMFAAFGGNCAMHTQI
ncbi:unnamed protein product [Camellia sinensis]